MHIQRVMERAENVTRVPQANSEFVQAGTGARAGVSVGLRVRSRVRRQATSDFVPVRHAHACAHALAAGPRLYSPRPYSLPTALIPTHGPTTYPTALLPTHGPTPHPRPSSPQVLQYEVGQYYGGHHDFIPAHSRLPCGPRVYTLFMYLSEVSK